MAWLDIFARGEPSPTDQTMGATAPMPAVRDYPQPPTGPPLGASGRANMWGLPSSDEMNRQLVGIEGLRRFDQMYWTDPHIKRLVLMAWAPILAGTWTLDPYGGDDASDLDREVADTIWWALTKHMSPNFFEHLATAGPVLLRSGFCPFEQVWASCEYQGKTLLMPRKLDLRLPRSVWRWWQDEFGELTHIAQILPNRPQAIIPATELVYYRLQSEGDNWQGLSLLRSAYKPWYLKDKLERIDAIGQERKAVGMPVVYCSPDVSDTVMEEVEKIVANAHMSEASYMMLKGWKMGEAPSSGVAGAGNQFLIDVIKFDSSSGESIQSSLQYHKQAIESSFAQDFMALGQHQVGARATAEVQEDPYLTAVDSLALAITPPLDRLIERIVEVNWGDKVDGPPSLHVSLHENASLSEVSGYVQQLVAAQALQPDPELEDHLRDLADLPAANADFRAAKQKATLAGLEQAGNPPDPLELAKAKAAGQPVPGAAKAGQGVSAREDANPKTPPAGGKQLDEPSPPPNLRDSTSPETASPEHECGTCRMFDAGVCWGYGNLPVNGEWVCDSWELSPDWRAQDAAEDRALDAPVEPTAKWFERLLSTDRLREAFDGARDHIEASCLPATTLAAKKLAYQAQNHQPLSTSLDPGLVTALTDHYLSMYELGHQTVNDELARQRKALGRMLDEPIDAAGGAAGSRIARARLRGQHSARNILGAINQRLGRDQIQGLKDPGALQAGALQAAQGQLRAEALANTAASINDGRYDGAMLNQDVIGAFYTSVLDERTCGPCETADDGTLLSPEDAVGFGPPNPDCDGADRCRCALIWTLSSDPSSVVGISS